MICDWWVLFVVVAGISLGYCNGRLHEIAKYDQFRRWADSEKLLADRKAEKKEGIA